ncbi:MAG: 2-oxo acid dehydrogenase subunit E2 [Deltaproteobacteria bacterium]|nr:2-oxo acid dehydrogenase subunit E2 [Deltaproteobacteria bacterium]
MPVKIVMPKLGLTMSEGLIVEWMKKEGDPVKKGEILFVLETEKVTYEGESPEDGILGKISVQVEETVPVGKVVAYLLKPGETMDDIKLAPAVESEKTVDVKAPATPPELEQTEVATDFPQAADDVRIKASPMAKKLAREYKIDLRTVKGTGPGSRILREDIEKTKETETAALVPASAEVCLEEKLVPFSGMRKAIARNMLASKNQTAQTYMSTTIDATEVQKSRQVLLARFEKSTGIRVTITDIMMKITAAAIKQHPVINTRWTAEGILYLADVHMGMAMAANDGLLVPVIRDMDKKGFAQISKDRLELITKVKEKRFMPDDISGSTFTLSAMGMFGIEQFTSNINLPENSILAVGAIIDKPVALNGEIVIRPMMTVTLTYDHRTIDGAEAGKFLQTLKKYVENPILMSE